MKSVLVATVVALLSAPAFADNVRGVTEHHYKDVVKKVPHTEYICETVEVPVYGQADDTTDGLLLGAIAGGLLGNQVGKGNGKTAATALGAVIGSQVGQNIDKQNSNNVVGYRQEERCRNRTTYQTNRQTVYSHSTVTFWDNGREYTLRFNK
jgi:outer membrane lipoprotein SlyB